MSLTIKLIVSLVIAVIAYTLTSILLTGTVQLSGSDFDLRLLFAFFFATAATALVVRDPQPADKHRPGQQRAEQSPGGTNDRDDGRERGQVKWFDAAKGYGFIIMENGEEIFVHHRSIRGEGRRSLRDGMPVNFTVTEGEKGPQAEDVTPQEN